MIEMLNSLYATPFQHSSLEGKRFLITGGAGFIGSHLVHYLLQHKATVTVLDNLATGFEDNLSPYLENKHLNFIKGDIRDFNTCLTAAQGCDYVLHQAALGSVPRSIADPLTSNEVNVNGFLNMLQASVQAKVKRFVYAASSSTYGDSTALPKQEEIIGKPLSPYAVTKYVNELYADVFSRTFGIETIGLRYFNVFGPRQSPKGAYAAVIPLFINWALHNEPIVINGDGSIFRDFTFIHNVVQANVLAALSSNSKAVNTVYNVAVGSRTTLLELAKAIISQGESRSTIQFVAPRLGDIQESEASIEKAITALKYQPQYKLNDGLSLTIQSFKDALKTN